VILSPSQKNKMKQMDRVTEQGVQRCPSRALDDDKQQPRGAIDATGSCADLSGGGWQ
jgi:hypothetical protein